MPIAYSKGAYKNWREIGSDLFCAALVFYDRPICSTYYNECKHVFRDYTGDFPCKKQYINPGAGGLAKATIRGLSSKRYLRYTNANEYTDADANGYADADSHGYADACTNTIAHPVTGANAHTNNDNSADTSNTDTYGHTCTNAHADGNHSTSAHADGNHSTNADGNHSTNAHTNAANWYRETS